MFVIIRYELIEYARTVGLLKHGYNLIPMQRRRQPDLKCCQQTSFG